MNHCRVDSDTLVAVVVVVDKQSAEGARVIIRSTIPHTLHNRLTHPAGGLVWPRVLQQVVRFQRHLDGNVGPFQGVPSTER